MNAQQVPDGVDMSKLQALHDWLCSWIGTLHIIAHGNETLADWAEQWASTLRSLRDDRSNPKARDYAIAVTCLENVALIARAGREVSVALQTYDPYARAHYIRHELTTVVLRLGVE